MREVVYLKSMKIPFLKSKCPAVVCYASLKIQIDLASLLIPLRVRKKKRNALQTSVLFSRSVESDFL